MRKLFVLIITCLPFMLIAQSNDYKIYDVKNSRIITSQELVMSLRDVDVIFFGEEHNDSVGHWLEADLFKQLFSSYPKTALSLEMFHTDVQVILDEYLRDNISERNFIKESRAWNNYKDYKPLIEFAKEKGLDVTAANAATRYSNLVTKSGLAGLKLLSKSSRTFLPPLPIDTAEGKYYSKFIEMMGAHSLGQMKMYQTQNLWDATMAWSITKYIKKHKGTKILQINGRFHSDDQLGTFAKFKKQRADLSLSNISCFYADDFSNPNWEKYKHLGDYIVVTDPKIKRSY
ncbi:MAG: ChaN family lipoprotein [Pedobacter sp.]|nr:ChaN family lipoprotein [Pedobacter sp.]